MAIRVITARFTEKTLTILKQRGVNGSLIEFMMLILVLEPLKPEAELTDLSSGAYIISGISRSSKSSPRPYDLSLSVRLSELPLKLASPVFLMIALSITLLAYSIIFCF